jgi:hypothetical protein
MNLVNRTPFTANFFNTIAGEDFMLGSVVLRTMHRIDGKLVPDPDRKWPVSPEPYKTEFGEFDGESPFVREGCDIFILGHAYPPSPAGTTAKVELRVGTSFQFSLVAFGDRRWVRQGRELVPSEPEPFQRMALTWERAFGGTCLVEGIKTPWVANPNGLGFYWEMSQAEGKPLPNLEDPQRTIQRWDDRPDPVATAPYSRDWGLRALNSADFDLSTPKPKIKRIKPSYYNNAPPRLILPRAPEVGDVVSVTGVWPRGERVEFRMPELAYHVYVQLESRRYVFPARLETLALLTEERRVMLGYRCCFRYRLVPLERRAAILCSGRNPPEPPAHYFISWDTFGKGEGLHA